MIRAIAGRAVVAASALAVSATAADTRPDRTAAIRRAQVWSATDIASKDLMRGPEAPDSFSPTETVRCEYVDKKLPGDSPKFACRIGHGDEVKVKFGGTNGEVYAEVAASRLLWALGFGADRMYPVKVICHGCPDSFVGVRRAEGDVLIDPAAIERKHHGTELRDNDEGWSWKELDVVSEAAGGAPRAHVEALTLLAVLLQHTDTKPEQQRLVCLDTAHDTNTCARPFMMIADLGLTFGQANLTNANHIGSTNLDGWSRRPIWKDAPGCVGNLPKSGTGTLKDPQIGEAGRRFLADLLVQLSDAQLHDLFEVARFLLRPRSPDIGRSGFPATQEWVDAFKQKRQQIVERRCA